VLAHWDARAEFAEASVMMVDGLRSAGLDVVVVSTSASHELLVSQLRGRVLAVVTRRNVGFDFLSWARGIEALRREDAMPGRLVLTNTSMYGPLQPLRPTLDRLWSLPSEVLGMTESREFRPHIQSWFMAFGPNAIQSQRFDAYWTQIRPAANKWGTILAHEQRWASDLALDGRAAAALLSADRTSRTRNPLTFTWKTVIRGGVPFVKRSLFLANPDRVDMRGWRDFVHEQTPGFDSGIVERDVRRLTNGAAP
jgi:lipopolysaccharide biosynthesis protein